MSKTKNMSGKDIRRQLLVTVSTAALFASVYSAGEARAADNDADRPLLWIEFGGQAERTDGLSSAFAPPFFSLASSADLAVMTDAQRPPTYSLGLDGKIMFQPEDSDWVFSAAIQYGRSNASKHLHHQGAVPPTIPFTFVGKYEGEHPKLATIGDTQAGSRESHTILDFQAGKDVGLGMFGARGSSVVSAGVRFAQFSSGSHATIHARPIAGYGAPVTDPGKYAGFRPGIHATYTAFAHSKRNTHAVGPSLSWDASVPFAGNGADATLNFDWGINAAVLFGRQRARVHHQTTGHHYSKVGGFYKYTINSGSYMHGPYDRIRSHNVTIPNVGGFAGISFHYGDAKISFGYRGDFFFGALDTGFDARKSTALGYFGPYASLSVGIGD